MNDIERKSADKLSPSVANEIRAEHEACERSARSAVEHAIRAGQLLEEVKAHLRHGEWLPWLTKNVPFSQQTANAYMRIAANYGTSRDLPASVNAALRGLAKPKRPLSPGTPRRTQHEDVEEELRRLFVRGEWRVPGTPESHAIPDASIAWAVLGVTLYKLDKAGAPRDFGYADLDEYLSERLPDVDNAWRGLEFEMAFRATGGNPHEGSWDDRRAR